MRAKKQILMAVVSVVTIISVAGVALAWEGYGKRGYGKDCRRGQGQGRMFQQWAQLTEAQQNQIQALHQQFRDETADTRIALISRQEQLNILMRTTSPDKAKIESLVNEMADLKKEMMQKGIDKALEVKKIAPEMELPRGFGLGFSRMGSRMGGFCKDGFGRMGMHKERRGHRGMGMGMGKGAFGGNAPRYDRRIDCPVYQATETDASEKPTVTE